MKHRPGYLLVACARPSGIETDDQHAQEEHCYEGGSYKVVAGHVCLMTDGLATASFAATTTEWPTDWRQPRDPPKDVLTNVRQSSGCHSSRPAAARSRNTSIFAALPGGAAVGRIDSSSDIKLVPPRACILRRPQASL